ncbi:hypothetical protein FOXYSP1_05046 [Fusarium oxysporum f. sp. phaseoli]
MPMSGLIDEQLIDEFKSIIAKSTNSRSRNFLGFPDATMCPAALGGSPPDTTSEPKHGEPRDLSARSDPC